MNSSAHHVQNNCWVFQRKKKKFSVPEADKTSIILLSSTARANSDSNPSDFKHLSLNPSPNYTNT